MRYKISFHGWDVEVLMEEVSEKLYNHFKENDLNVTDHMCGSMEDELSEDITDGICYDTKFECDSLYHNCGPLIDNSVTMYVHQEDTNEEVYSSSLDFCSDYKHSLDCEQEVYLLEFEHRYILVGEIYSKGYASEYVLSLPDNETFDPSKLTLLYNDIDESFEIITGVQYNNVDLECTGEMDTKGKKEIWYISDTETREKTRTD